MPERHPKITTSRAYDFIQYRTLLRQFFEPNMNTVRLFQNVDTNLKTNQNNLVFRGALKHDSISMGASKNSLLR